MALLVGLVQGLLLWFLHHAVVDGVWPATGPGWWPAFYLMVVLLPPTLLLLWEQRTRRTLKLILGGMALFLAFSSRALLGDWPVPGTGEEPDEVVVLGYLLPLAAAWLLAVPFLRASLAGGRWPPTYAVLFRSASRSYLTLLESAAVTLLFWGLIGLWSALFLTLGIEWFRDLFTRPGFVYPATCVVFATAVRLVAGSDRLMDGLLDQLLGLLKWLAPLALVILVAFVAALVPRLPTLLASGERVMDSQWLLCLVGALVLLLNAAFRDGESEPGYGRWLAQALRLAPPLMLIVAVTAAYSIIVRSTELGLTPPRIWGLAIAGMAVLSSAGYSYASLRRGPWLGALTRVNPGLVMITVAVLLLALTPVGDPLRWSIANQRARALAAATPEAREGPLAFLRFDAGQDGRRVLAELAGGKVAGISPALQAEAAAMASLPGRGAKPALSPDVLRAEVARWREGLRTLPEDSPFAAQFQASLDQALSRLVTEAGAGEAPPLLWLVLADTDGDGVEDGLLIVGPRPGAAARSPRYLPLLPTND
jgi:hypothetical protein